MQNLLTIACLQTRPMPDMASALAEALPLAEQAVAAGAKMLFLPEYCGGLKTNGAQVCPPKAEQSDHAFLAAFREFAKQNEVWVNLGSIAVTGEGGKFANRGFMIDARGGIYGTYDKVHLFDVQLSEGEIYRESDTVLRGETAVVHHTPLAAIGHTICYDLRFPNLYRDLAQAGADILCCPAAFTKRTGEAHWHILNRARAIENTRFVVSACAVGPVPGGGESYGHSLIIDPWGGVLADGGDQPGVVFAELDLAMVGQTQSAIPSLSHDRPFGSAKNPVRSVA